ncbi:MAG: 2,3-bisphosphoglycerate-independent phosphoglycerate mutase [Alphaproteobacteria bacterium]|nr:2,3-bisphosphoglycerate-independent phosphoglycerate mutase [Alphaproteobacteria bacterium]
MNTASPQWPAVLCVLDGWGERSATADNAIALARTPVWDRFVASCPHSQLDASAEQVGLPTGQMGNSEVGHMNLGAGRVVLQDLPRIDVAIADGSLARNTVLATFAERMKRCAGTVHLIGLMSPGGVHSHQGHITELARILCDAEIPVRVHAILDGRDTPPRSAAEFLRRFIDDTSDLDGLRIATICGRYYAMDRDSRWDRVAPAYEAIVAGAGAHADDPIAAIAAAYDAGRGDEFVEPTVIGDYAGCDDGDGIVMANFRADRVRQLLTALLDPNFDAFPRAQVTAFSNAVGMVGYSEALNRFLGAVFPAQQPVDTLGQIVADNGRTQLRIAETEKYAHVTFFFNGGRETPFDGEQRILVPSPKVATYDLQPEMSAPEVTDRLIDAIDSGQFDFIVVNYANTDMVGHTGNLDAAILAVETVDGCLGRVDAAIARAGGVLLITADHGNAEMMRDDAGNQPHTAHSRNPVPCILVNGPADVVNLESGCLADVAPTVLALMAIGQPAAMSGRSLLVTSGSRNLAEAAA